MDKITGCKEDYYYINPNRNLNNLGKIVLVELTNFSDYPQIPTDMTEALFQAIQKKQLFSLSLIRQNNLDWKSLRIENCQQLSIEQFAAIRKTLNCDAVIIGSVTSYEPYPYLSIGLRLKLIDLSDGSLLWAVEQIWDSNDKKTEKRIKDYYSKGRIIGPDSLRTNIGTISSRKFIKFVADQTADTMTEK